MAGIWNRIIPGEDRVSSHLLKAAMYLSVRGVFTDQNLLSAINSKLATPLDAQSVADLSTIKSAIVAASTLQAKLDLFERFDALNIAVENGVLQSETVYRTQMGI